MSSRTSRNALQQLDPPDANPRRGGPREKAIGADAEAASDQYVPLYIRLDRDPPLTDYDLRNRRARVDWPRDRPPLNSQALGNRSQRYSQNAIR